MQLCWVRTKIYIAHCHSPTILFKKKKKGQVQGDPFPVFLSQLLAIRYLRISWSRGCKSASVTQSCQGPSPLWMDLFLIPFRLVMANVSHDKESHGLMAAGYEIVSFYAVKAVSCQHPLKAKHGLPGWELRHCRWDGGCSKGKDRVPCARQLFKKKKKSGRKRNGNLGIHSSGTWARGWMSRRVSGCRGREERSPPRCAHPSLASRLGSEMSVSHQS